MREPSTGLDPLTDNTTRCTATMVERQIPTTLSSNAENLIDSEIDPDNHSSNGDTATSTEKPAKGPFKTDVTQIWSLFDPPPPLSHTATKFYPPPLPL